MVVTISPSIPSPIMQGKKGISVIKGCSNLPSPEVVPTAESRRAYIGQSAWLETGGKPINFPRSKDVQRFLLEGSYSPYP